MEDPLSLFMVVGPFVGVALFCCLGALFVGGVFFFLTRQSVKAFTTTPEHVGPDFLAQTVPTLLPWSPQQAFPDLAARWRGWWRSFSGVGRRSGGRFQGEVKSLNYPERSWLAFTLERTQYWNATMQLHTSDNRLEMTVNFEKIGAFTASGGVATFTYDGQPLGSFHVTGGQLFDGAGRPVGRYRRRTGPKVAITPNWGPVEIDGRVIGEINDLWYRMPQTVRPPRPALRNLAFNLTDQDCQWLLALLAVELYYDSMYQRRID